MRTPASIRGFVCLLICASTFGQTSKIPNNRDYLVTLHQLEHKAPTKANNLFTRATELLKKHKFQSGLELLQRAIDIDPSFWEAQNDLGYSYLVLKDNVHAEQAFQRAIDIDPANAIGYMNMSVAALACREYDLAAKSATRALRLNPMLPQARAVIAITSVSEGKWTGEARKLLEQIQGQVPVATQLLRVWPREGQRGPEVSVVTAELH